MWEMTENWTVIHYLLKPAATFSMLHEEAEAMHRAGYTYLPKAGP
jgi:hypothetical protein